MTLMLGAHLPAAGGLCRAVEQARNLECQALQIFAKSPRQWQGPVLTAEDARTFRRACREAGIQVVASHAAYLINLAAGDPDMLRRSREAMADELERAAMLGCRYAVVHAGAATGYEPDSISSGAAAECLKESLVELLRGSRGSRVLLAVENTAGQGSCLGANIRELGALLRSVRAPRLVLCLDTCHLLAAGYDLAGPQGLARVLAELDDSGAAGLLRLMHLNDSMFPLASRRDRHQHLGEGCIGTAGLRRVLRHPRLCHLPFLLETPEMETRVAGNLETARRLAAAATGGASHGQPAGKTSRQN